MATVLILAFAIAEPLMAVVMHALDHSLSIVNTTISTCMGWQVVKVVRLDSLHAFGSNTDLVFSLVCTGHRTRNLRHSIAVILITQAIRLVIELFKLVVKVISVVVILRAYVTLRFIVTATHVVLSRVEPSTILASPTAPTTATPLLIRVLLLLLLLLGSDAVNSREDVERAGCHALLGFLRFAYT